MEIPVKHNAVRVSYVALLAMMFLFFAPSTARASTLVLPPNNLNLVAYYPMNEGTGTTTRDASGSGNTGTLSGSPSWGDGKFGKTVVFDGTDDYVNLASVPVSSAAFTVCAWFKVDNVTDYETIFSMSVTGANNNYFVLQTRGDVAGDPLEFQLYKDPTSVSARTTNSVQAGVWQFACAVEASATDHKVYLNGTGVGSDTTSVVPAGINNTTVGVYRGSAFDGYFNGSIDDVRIYSRALGASEISRMYQQGSAKRASVNTTGLVGYWRFNEGTGTVAADIGSGRNNGTLTGGPSWVTGKFSNGLSFDGTSNYVDAGTASSLNLTTAVTSCAWVYKTGNNWAPFNNKYHTAFYKDSLWNGTGYGVYVYERGQNGGELRYGANGLEYIVGTGSSVSYGVNTWVHVCGVKSPSGNTLYLNGVAVATEAGSSPATNSGPLRIGFPAGSYAAQDIGWLGLIDDVRIYNRALSAAEVLSLYADTSAARVTKVNTSHANSMTNGLVGLWSFDGPDLTTTTATDRSTSGNNGTLSGTPVPVSGRLGQALKFDGTDDYVALSDNSFSSNTAGTISSWVKIATSGSTQRVFSSSVTGATDLLNVSIDGSDKLLVQKYSSSPSVNDAIEGNTALSTNTWYHVAVVSNGSAYSLYVNGVAQSLTALAGSNSGKWFSSLNGSTHAVRIGHMQYVDQNLFFTGSIDEVRIYNRALSAGEVTQLYNMGK